MASISPSLASPPTDSSGCQGCRACLLVGHQRYSVRIGWGVREGESTRRAKGGGDSVVGGDRPEVASMEIVELTNEKVNVVR